jgi:hypothetical protein
MGLRELRGGLRGMGCRPEASQRATSRTWFSSVSVAKGDGVEVTPSVLKGSNSDPVWKEIPEDLFYVAHYASLFPSDYPPGT